MKRFTFLAVTTMLILPLSCLAGPAESQEGDGEIILSTKCDSDDLATTEARFERLKDAVEEVCGATDIRNAGSLLQAMNHRECIEETLARAVAALDDEGLRIVHEEHVEMTNTVASR
jgi:UrcA family protein